MSAEERADVVIIGSGFGGAVAACRLSGHGRSVVVLERGRDWSQHGKTPQRWRDYVYSSRMPHRLNGWLDLRVLDQMMVATGAGVGGGSLIYANVCVDAKPIFFQTGWPSQITADVMAPYYGAVEDVLLPQQIPVGQLNPRMHLLQHAAAELGWLSKYETLPLAVAFDTGAPDRGGAPWTNPDGYADRTCVHCGDCVIGCTNGAKRTLDQNYLAKARDQGAEIWPLSMVTHISEGPGGAWRVHYLDISKGRQSKREIVGKTVILAAGSIGSPEILLRSRDRFRTLKKLPRALGRGWSPNGDFLTLAKYPESPDQPLLHPTKGPTIGARIDLLDGVDLPDDNVTGYDGRIFVEDGGLPNIGAHLLKAWDGTGGLKGWAYGKASKLTDFSDMIPWFGQSIDAADGEFSLRNPLKFWRARTQLNWNPQRSVSALDTFNDVHIAMTLATGGEPMPSWIWKRLRMLVTPHPLGGCNMASAPGAGVTNDLCEIWGFKNLYVMDGSVIPRAIGRNPSKTIAAVAERSCEALVASF